MSSPSNEAAPPVSDATPPVPPASPPQQQKRPLLRQSSVIDLTGAAATEEELKDKSDEQEAKRARDQSFKPAVECPKRAQIRQALGEIQLHSNRLVSLVANLEPEGNAEFMLQVERTFSLAFSEAFSAIDKSVKPE